MQENLILCPVSITTDNNKTLGNLSKIIIISCASEGQKTRDPKTNRDTYQILYLNMALNTENVYKYNFVI